MFHFEAPMNRYYPWTNNRAASYLARDMKVNRLMGAEYFESQLIDYDPASNYGNRAYTVGMGTGPWQDRYFDPQEQAQKHGADARYRHRGAPGVRR